MFIKLYFRHIILNFQQLHYILVLLGQGPIFLSKCIILHLNRGLWLHSRGIGLCIALQEEAHTLLVRPVWVEAWHHHDFPGQVPHEARRAEHRLTQPAESLHNKAEGSL